MIANVLGRFLAGLVRRMGVTTLLSLILLGIALGSIANGLAGMIRNLDTRPFWLVIAGGALFGWLLAKSPLPGWLAGPVAVVVGTGALSIQVGRLETEFLSLVRVYLRLSGETWRLVKTTPHNVNTIDTTSLSEAFHLLVAGFDTLFLRARHWLDALASGEVVFDPIAAALVWGCGLWIVTVWAAWFVRRKERVFVGVLPAGGLYAFALYYTGMGSSLQSLVVMMGAILLLCALRSYAVHERGWQAVDLDRVHSPLELGVTVVSLTGALMLAAALAPSLSVRQMAKAFDTLAVPWVSDSPKVAESLGLETRPEQVEASSQAEPPGIPTHKLIGAGSKLTTTPVMHVSVAGYDPFPQAALGFYTPTIPPRYYWRSFTYDQYSGRGWYTSPFSLVDYPPGEPDLAQLDENHQWVRQRIYPLIDLGGFVYAAGELLSLDAAYQVAWRAPGDALAVQSAGQSYTAVSSVPFVTETELRSAGTSYPEWISQRYLQLPEEVPDRVRSLAYDLTAVQPTPYDQALAIEAYLRTISYTLAVPAPPLDRDVADYFLFDLRRGYCDYFATAMVVLARSVGIPARLVTGYASGGYDVISAQFVVLEKDAHSWAEIYFPSYGWVEFEPTSGLAPIDHTGQGLGSAPAYEQPSGQDTEARAEEPAGRHIDVAFWASALLLAASVGGLVWWGVQSWQVHRMTPDALVAYIYRRLYRQGRWFGLRGQPGETAGEFSERLQLRVAKILLPDRTLKASDQARHEGLVGYIARDLHSLTLLYEKSLFSAEPLELQEKAAALETWQSLRGNLRRAWWRGLRYLLPNLTPPER